jgi:DNA-binding NarL/FixJ family response regulator
MSDLIRVVVLTTYADDADILAALRAGALGYLTKDASRSQIAHAVRAGGSRPVGTRPAGAAAPGSRRRPAQPTAPRAPAPRAGPARPTNSAPAISPTA